MAACGIIYRLLIAFFVIFCVQGGEYQPSAIRLTEDSWQDILEGQWMVEFMAPWCPACRSFKETWDGFARKWSRDLDVKVSFIDVTECPGLSGRFLITALPSIYHVKDGIFRQYTGGRTENDLVTFIDDKHWQDLPPVSKWTAPDSIQMGLVGTFFRLAMKIRSFYTLMTEEYGIPEWGCYVIFAVITIITGLLLGLLLVCLCDFVYPTKQYPPPIPQELMRPDMDKEGDIIDDTKTGDDDDDNDGTTIRKRNVNKDNSDDNGDNKDDDGDNNDDDGDNDDDDGDNDEDTSKDNDNESTNIDTKKDK
ncbi:Thioredoxin-related transmembrane protein 1 [Mactra antiquata]